ncbi:MAG: excalibur calcium-binding domain-containing protein [Gordonia sp. (in: high G+C Gram-positive bacteria)]
MKTWKTASMFVGAVAMAGAMTFGVNADATAAPQSHHSQQQNQKFRSCAALNRVYPHGVARVGAHDAVGRHQRAVRNFRVNNRVYALNRGLDTDRDGVACERR